MEFSEYTEPYERHQELKGYICELVQHSELIPLKNQAAMSNCGEWLTFNESEDGVKLVGASFCRQRICPMCQWRKAERQFSNCIQIAEYLSNNGYRFLHVVLTTKNCDGGVKLTETVHKLYTAFGLLMKKAKVKRAFKGVLRTLEVSYNYDTHQFHPHLHCLVAVNKSYFNDPKSYISYDLLTQMWTDCLKQSVTAMCSVGAVKNELGFAEVSKYCLKPLELNEIYENDNLYILAELFATLKGARFVHYFGVIKEARKALKLKDEDEECEHLELDKENNISYHYNIATRRYEKIS